MGAVMTRVVAELPWSLTAAWVILIAWAIAQVIWFQRARVTIAHAAPSRRESSVRRPAAKPAAPALPIGGTPEFLAELGLHDPDSTDSGDEGVGSVYR